MGSSISRKHLDHMIMKYFAIVKPFNVAGLENLSVSRAQISKGYFCILESSSIVVEADDN
jgi:hypothetical protein